jgi:hypothetical protein
MGAIGLFHLLGAEFSETEETLARPFEPLLFLF